ncbi:hypothetical protein [Microbispora corallina]|uniref:hypothetical protein n=1 Tax=Microbispora corallina TaxID=83302 RepID=UPI00194F401B|nr:hypothetical protein [Microbispora corallina]
MTAATRGGTCPDGGERPEVAEGRHPGAAAELRAHGPRTEDVEGPPTAARLTEPE